jgi:hypothetical protein
MEHFGRDEHRLALVALQGLSEDLLRLAIGVHVGGIEEIYASVQAQTYLAARSLHLRVADRTENARSAEAHAAETQSGYLQAAAAQETHFHRELLEKRTRRAC